MRALVIEPVVDAEPGVEQRAVTPLPPDVALEGRERVIALQGGSYGRDEGEHPAFLRQRAHGPQYPKLRLLSLLHVCPS